MARIIFSNLDSVSRREFGGAAVAIHEAAKFLAKQHSVQVLTAKLDNTPDTIIEGIRYRHIGLRCNIRKIRLVLFMVTLWFYVVKESYDLWFEGLTYPIATLFLPLFTRVGIGHSLNAEEIAKIYKFPFHRIERLGVKMYGHFVVGSNEQQQEVLLINPHAQTYIIPNGVDKSYFSIERRPKNQILFLGRVNINQKGHDLIIPILPDIFNEYPDYQLIIAGWGYIDEVRRTQAMVSEYNCARFVQFTGLVRGKEKENLFSSAKVFVQPSRYENSSLVTLEAMASGVPVVLFDIEGFKWIPDDCVVKVAPFDTQAFRDAIIKLLADERLAEAQSARAKDFARDFTWDIIGARYEACADSLLKETV